MAIKCGLQGSERGRICSSYDRSTTASRCVEVAGTRAANPADRIRRRAQRDFHTTPCGLPLWRGDAGNGANLRLLCHWNGAGRLRVVRLESRRCRASAPRGRRIGVSDAVPASFRTRRDRIWRRRRPADRRACPDAEAGRSRGVHLAQRRLSVRHGSRSRRRFPLCRRHRERDDHARHHAGILRRTQGFATTTRTGSSRTPRDSAAARRGVISTRRASRSISTMQRLPTSCSGSRRCSAGRTSPARKRATRSRTAPSSRRRRCIRRASCSGSAPA